MQFCNEAKSCAHWLVNETLWYETETRPRHLIFSPRRDRDLPTFPRDRDETETLGNYVSRPSRDRDVETETTSLSKLHDCVLTNDKNAWLKRFETSALSIKYIKPLPFLFCHQDLNISCYAFYCIAYFLHSMVFSVVFNRD